MVQDDSNGSQEPSSTCPTLPGGSGFKGGRALSGLNGSSGLSVNPFQGRARRVRSGAGTTRGNLPAQSLHGATAGAIRRSDLQGTGNSGQTHVLDPRGRRSCREHWAAASTFGRCPIPARAIRGCDATCRRSPRGDALRPGLRPVVEEAEPKGPDAGVPLIFARPVFNRGQALAQLLGDGPEGAGGPTRNTRRTR